MKGVYQLMLPNSVFNAATDKGLVRSNNEDEYLILKSKDNRFVLLILADGMGGHKSGDEASKIAVRYTSFMIDRNFRDDMSDKELLDLLDQAIEAANVQVQLEALASPEKSGMGTTLTVALIVNKHLYLGHVGDSRFYLLRNNDFYQITKDDTYVQSLVDKGELNSAEAASHPQNNILIKAIGSNDAVNPQLLDLELQESDKFLMCSDGLYDVLSNRDIKEILSDSQDTKTCVNEYIKQTLKKGAPDNVTVIAGFI